MTDQAVDQTTEETGLDRRSLLRKAAAAGAIAWTVPVVMSSPALANSCTPSCAVGAFSPAMFARDVCSTHLESLPDFDQALEDFIGNSNKMSVLSILAPGGLTCPCDGGTPVSVIGSLPATIPKVGSESQYPGACTNTSPAFFVDTFSLASYQYTDPGGQAGVTAANSFLAGKAGAIGNGTFRIPNICVSIGCKDDTGDTVWHKCFFSVCFTYLPSGACNSVVPLQYSFSAAANCTIGCDPC